MRIGRSKTGAAGHIKKNTRGTSNEISFSVLDSMKGQDEEDDGASPLGRISLFTLGAKKPASTPSKQPTLPGKSASRTHATPHKATWKSTDHEVTARRSRRKRSRRMVVGLISVACLIGIVFAGIIGVGRYQQMQERALNLTSQIEDVRQQYSVAEPFLTLVKDTLATPLADIDRAALEQQLTEWESRQQSITTKLRATKTAIENIEGQSSGAELERANKAIGVVNATIKAMEAGRTALTEVSDAASSYAQAESFMTHAMEGDADAREAVSGDLTDAAAANAAIEMSAAAITEFAAARDAVQAVIASAGGMIDQSGQFEATAAELLQPFVDYANLRIQAQEHAQEADKGFLATSSQQMIDANASYNAAEEQAADLIADLRGSYPTDIVQRAYEATIPTSESVTAWQAEWTRAQQLLEG